MRYTKFPIYFFLIVVLSPCLYAQNRFAGQVVDVLDGRTVVIEIANAKVTAVLQFIEVPEVGQQLNRVVIDHLRQLLIGKVVEFKARAIVGNRTIGRIMLKDTDISQQMLRDGAAWLVPPEVTGPDAPEREYYAASETAARTDKLGVWSVRDLQPAWEFRNAKEEKARRDEELYWEQYARAAKPGAPSRTRPAAGINNAGALINKYNPLTKKGSLETPVLPVQDPGGFRKVAGSFAYLYREDSNNRRTGDFAILFLSLSDQAKFRSSDMVITVDRVRVEYVRAKRTERTEGNGVVESMVYLIKRSTIEKIANGNTVILKMGNYPILMLPGFQMVLFNLLDASK